jgi:hypothetical protein
MTVPARPLVLCWNDHLEEQAGGKGVFHLDRPCRDNYRSADPRPMVIVAETVSGWSFRCQTCGWRRVWTKNLVGGTMGAGGRDDRVGPGKGTDRLRSLGGVLKP